MIERLKVTATTCVLVAALAWRWVVEMIGGIGAAILRGLGFRAGK